MYKFKNKKKNTRNTRNTKNTRNKESKSIKIKKVRNHDNNIDLDSLANDTIIINEAIKGLNKENKKTFRKIVSGKHKQLKRTINKLKKGKKLPIDKKQIKRSIKSPIKKKRIKSGAVVPEKGQPPPLPPRTEKQSPPPLPPRPGNDILGPKKKPPNTPQKNDQTNLKQETIKSGTGQEPSKKSSGKWKYLAAGAAGIGIAATIALGNEPDENLFEKLAGDDNHLTKDEFEDAFGEDGFDGQTWDEISDGKDEIDFDTFHDEIGDNITEKIEELCKPDDDGNSIMNTEACANYDLGTDMNWNSELIQQLDSE